MTIEHDATAITVYQIRSEYANKKGIHYFNMQIVKTRVFFSHTWDDENKKK